LLFVISHTKKDKHIANGRGVKPDHKKICAELMEYCREVKRRISKKEKRERSTKNKVLLFGNRIV
jgi:hypothetical protein